MKGTKRRINRRLRLENQVKRRAIRLLLAVSMQMFGPPAVRLIEDFDQRSRFASSLLHTIVEE